MKRASRVFLVLTFTLGLAVAGALYPYLARGSAWLDVTWQHPRLLFLLLLVPVAWYLGTFAQDRRVPRLRVGVVAPLAIGPRGLRAWLRDVPGAARAVALALFVLALARPVNVLSDQKVDEKGIDIVIVLDVSNSMAAVMDADPSILPGAPRPQPGKRLTRLDTARLVIADFIARRKSDRIGVVDGYGTAIGDALGTAVARLRHSDAASKVVVLLTDGDSNAGAVAPEQAAQLAANIGAKVHTIQIGNGEEVEVYSGTDLFGQPVYRKDRFPVNPALLKSIAEKTGAQAFVATDAAALVGSMHSVLDALEKTRFEASSSSFEDLFPMLVIPGVLLIALDALLRAFLLRRFP
jgi:Ca-activated chloride channel family protein